MGASLSSIFVDVRQRLNRGLVRTLQQQLDRIYNSCRGRARKSWIWDESKVSHDHRLQQMRSTCHWSRVLFIRETDNLRAVSLLGISAGTRVSSNTRHRPSLRRHNEMAHPREICENSIICVEQLHLSRAQALLQLLRNDGSCFPAQLRDA